MKAAIFDSAHTDSGSYVRIGEVSRPAMEAGHVLLRVVACGVCRTDLHIVERDLPPVRQQLIPGHQIVGEVVDGQTAELPLGTRVGVSWMGGVDGECWYCRHGMENLCDNPTFTGYTVNGGYAEYAAVRADFAFPLPAGLDDVHVAPWPLCYARVSSVFGLCVLPGWNAASGWDYSALAAPQVWRFLSCNPGIARSML